VQVATARGRNRGVQPPTQSWRGERAKIRPEDTRAGGDRLKLEESNGGTKEEQSIMELCVLRGQCLKQCSEESQEPRGAKNERG